jgi:hypothetical protein
MRRNRIGLVTGSAMAIVAAVAGVVPAASASVSAGPSVMVTVDSGHPGGRLPDGFVGLSFEMRELGIGNLDPHRGNMVALLRTLGRSNIRISGNTLDRDTLWASGNQPAPDPLPDWVKDVVTPADVQRLGRFLTATGWRAEVGVNLGRWDAARAADQAETMVSTLGPRLAAVECGNEPDQWVGKGFRPTGYAYADYRKDWETCAAAVGDAPIAGPDTASPTSAWASSLAADERANGLAAVMVHQYSMDPTGTVARLLSPATVAAQRDAARPVLAAATAQHLPMRIDETNSAWGGGIDGVSNKQAAALWALDYSMEMAQLGLAGINFHGGLGVCNKPIWNGKWQLYTPMCAADTADETAQVYHAMPIYYGLWMARQLGPGRFLPVTVTTDRNVTAYAVRGDDGHLRIVVVEKDDASAGPVHTTLQLGRGAGTARVLHLTGSSLTADDTAIQGATVDHSGQLRPGRADRIRVDHSRLSLDLAGGSAVLITL